MLGAHLADGLASGRLARNRPCPRLVPALGSPQIDTGPWHIRVYSITDLDGVRSISPGLEPTAATVLPGPHPEVTVSYVLKRPWIPGLPWSVSFRTEPPGTAVPPMVLVAHQRVVPLSVDDGQIVARFPSGSDGSHFPVRIPANLPRHNARVFPDPNVEPDALDSHSPAAPRDGVRPGSESGVCAVSCSTSIFCQSRHTASSACPM